MTTNLFYYQTANHRLFMYPFSSICSKFELHFRTTTGAYLSVHIRIYIYYIYFIYIYIYKNIYIYNSIDMRFYAFFFFFLYVSRSSRSKNIFWASSLGDHRYLYAKVVKKNNSILPSNVTTWNVGEILFLETRVPSGNFRNCSIPMRLDICPPFFSIYRFLDKSTRARCFKRISRFLAWRCLAIYTKINRSLIAI